MTQRPYPASVSARLAQDALDQNPHAVMVTLSRPVLESLAAHAEAVETLTETVRCLRAELFREQDAAQLLRFQDAYGLTEFEAKVAAFLYTSHGVMVSKQALWFTLYEEDLDATSKLADVWIYKLRRKLGPGIIENVWGRGWRLTPAGKAFLDRHEATPEGAEKRAAYEVSRR